MKNIILVLFTLIFVGYSCNSNQTQTPVLSESIAKIGVFDGYGASQSCVWETAEAIKIDDGMEVRIITTSDIANGCLDSLDAIIFPGGSGSRQYLNLGHKNHDRIRNFVANGGGALGICAGAYLFTNTPDYASLSISGAEAIDIEHDNRGHGLSKITLSDEGKILFPELADRDTSYVMYFEGPVIINADDTINYTSFGTMESDVHEEGNAPANMTNGKPFFIGNRYGKGKVFSSVGHPEYTPGMHWIIPRIVRWTLDMDYVSYSDNAVRPTIFEKEMLFSKEMLKRESEYFYTLLYGSPEEKIEALDWLESKMSAAAKRWIQGLLYDSSAIVRARAAKYIANSEFTYYLPDLRAALNNENDEDTYAILNSSIQFLEDL